MGNSVSPTSAAKQNTWSTNQIKLASLGWDVIFVYPLAVETPGSIIRNDLPGCLAVAIGQFTSQATARLLAHKLRGNRAGSGATTVKTCFGWVPLIDSPKVKSSKPGMVFESLCTADALEAPSWMRGIAPTNPPTLQTAVNSWRRTLAWSRPQPARSHFVQKPLQLSNTPTKQTDLLCCPKRECVQNNFRSFKTAEDRGPGTSFRT